MPAAAWSALNGLICISRCCEERMRLYDQAFEGDLAGLTVVGSPSVSGASPLHGQSMTFSFGSVNCIELDMPFAVIILYGGLWWYGSTTDENAFFEYRTASVASGDFRFNSDGLMEFRLGGALIKTGTKVFESGRPYHIQFYLVVSSTVGRLETKINDSPYTDMSFLGDTQGAGGPVEKVRYGSVKATGSGSGWIDDIALNWPFGDDISTNSWTGPLSWVAGEPVAVTNPDEWVSSGGAKEDNVAEVPNDGDATYITTDVNGARQAFTFAPIAIPPGTVPEAVKYEIVVRGTTPDQPGIVRLGFASGSSANEVQTVTLTGVTSPWQLSFDGVATPYMNPGASATDVQVSLRSLKALAPDAVTVSGAAGGPYTVTFGTHMAGTAQPLLSGGATAGTLSFARSTTGSGIVYGGVPFGPNPVDLTDSYNESLPGDDYLKRVARRSRNLDGSRWTVATANDSHVVLRVQGIET